MGRNPNRTIDRTFLSLDLAEERGLIHRDYIAHCLRWSHVARFLQQSGKYAKSIVLDVGCGKELPLAKLLYVNKMTPPLYIGVDANDFEVPEMMQGKKIPIRLWCETDFCDLEAADVSHAGKLPNVLVNYECLEHVTPGHARRMLQKFQDLTSDDCNYFISTPCWNGSAAGNHINEMTFCALGSLIEDLNYRIEGVWGTFASISDYKDQLSAVTVVDGEAIHLTDLRPVFAALRTYYDTNVLAAIFAPLFPAQSRNCLWHLTKKTGDAAKQERMFSALETAPTPWSQSDNWRDLAG